MSRKPDPLVRWNDRRPEVDPAATIRKLAMTLAVVVTLLVLFLARGPLTRLLRGDAGCGWTVQGEVVLDRDVVDCARHGVRLGPFSKLDCAGHEIRGRDGNASGYGVRIDGVEQAEVRNCLISGFSRGVRIRGGRDNRVMDNQIDDTGYGVEIAGATEGGRSEGHRIARNRVSKSARDGIHLGAGASAASIEDNVIVDSAEEGLAIESCRGCLVIGNTVERSGSAAMDFKNSVQGRFEDNVVRGSVVKLRGASTGNVFVDNELEESGYVFAAVKPEGGVEVAPSKNRILGGSVVGGKVCFRFKGAHDNIVDEVEVSGCRVREDRSVGAAQASGNEVSVLESVPGS